MTREPATLPNAEWTRRCIELLEQAVELRAEVERLKTEREQLKVLLRTCRGLLPQHYTRHIDAIDDAAPKGGGPS